VQREFRPIEWSQSARAVLEMLDVTKVTEDDCRTWKTGVRRYA
jgi:hypothetical protein